MPKYSIYALRISIFYIQRNPSNFPSKNSKKRNYRLLGAVRSSAKEQIWVLFNANLIKNIGA
jgi:hypothetical protein